MSFPFGFHGNKARNLIAFTLLTQKHEKKEIHDDDQITVDEAGLTQYSSDESDVEDFDLSLYFRLFRLILLFMFPFIAMASASLLVVFLSYIK